MFQSHVARMYKLAESGMSIMWAMEMEYRDEQVLELLCNQGGYGPGEIELTKLEHTMSYPVYIYDEGAS